MTSGSRARTPDGEVDRRRLLVGSGALALGVIGASQVVVAPPAAAAGLGYTPIAPYRSYDSRGGTPLPSDTYRDIDLWTDQYGNGQIPTTAVAVTYNLTVTTTVSAGWMLVWPSDQGEPEVSSINWWTSGLTIANGGTVRLGTSTDSGPASASFGCGGGGASTHFLVDITGYYQ